MPSMDVNDYYFVSNITYCQNKTAGSYIYNITSPYTDSTNRASIVGTSVAMFTLTTLFFNLNFFSRVSHVSSILHPTIRLVRAAALSLFLPVMSYLFSDAKNSGGNGVTRSPEGASAAELSLRARLILTWMLLVELLRHKAEAILASAGVQGYYSGTVEHAARIVWLGNLVFFSIQSPGRRSVFAILWVMAAAKLVRRIVITELTKRSFAFGRNPDILTPYMAEVLKQEQHIRWDEEHPGDAQADQLLTSCRFAVMGEENLGKTVGPYGYLVDLPKGTDDPVVTVGKIWTLAERDELLASNPRLKRLSLSFALFKLLRRRLENPMAISKLETRCCRNLIYHGLRSGQGGATTADPHHLAAVPLFQMVNDELNFLSEYYHSVLPVVLASPFFFVVNYVLFPVMLCCLCVMTIVLCGNGDVPLTLYSITQDNSFLSFGLTKTTVCLMIKVFTSPPAFLSAIDLSITFFLFLIFIYEEVWELIVFLLSDWFMVSLLSDYYTTSSTSNRSGRQRYVRWAIQCIMWVKHKVGLTTLKLKQLDVLMPPCRRCLSPTLPAASIPKEVKCAVVHYLAARAGDYDAALGNGNSALAQRYSHLSWACESESIAEVILTWHIATRLFEVRHPEKKGEAEAIFPGRKAATSLSRYCAYLVAFHPELLPNDRNKTEHVYKTVNKDLKQALGLWGYYCLLEGDRYEKIIVNAVFGSDEKETVVDKGVRLGKELMEEAVQGREGAVWKVLGDLWVELIVYVSPAGDEVHVNGHRAALMQGGEFVTLLWALATHTGIARQPFVPSEVEIEIEDVSTQI